MPDIRPLRARSDMFQRYETLRRNREKRTHAGLFFLEGVHPVEQAVAAGEDFVCIGYDGGKRLSGWAQDMIAKAAPETLHPMPTDMLRELSDRENPCELVCLMRQRTDLLARLRSAASAAPNPLLVLCDRPNTPGNLGTILRSADAFGACGVMTCGHSADFYDPQCIRASIGTLFHVPFCAFGSVEETLSFLNSLPVRPKIVGTSAHGTAGLHEADLSGPVVLIVGNETFGMSRAWKESCDELLRIPIYGAASSLNVGCAASICLYEIARQRHFDGHR